MLLFFFFFGLTFAESPACPSSPSPHKLVMLIGTWPSFLDGTTANLNPPVDLCFSTKSNLPQWNDCSSLDVVSSEVLEEM